MAEWNEGGADWQDCGAAGQGSWGGYTAKVGGKKKHFNDYNDAKAWVEEHRQPGQAASIKADPKSPGFGRWL